MPIKSLELKPLYIAKTWEDLKKRADDHKLTAPTTPTAAQSLIKGTLSRLYEEAKKAQITGDEERAYILYFRYFATFKSIRESKIYEKDKSFYDSLVGPIKVKEVLQCLSDLTDSLTKRFSALKESQELRAKEIAESNAKSTNGSNDTSNKTSSANARPNEVNDNSYPVIDCQTLFESFENSTEMTRILIFDTRSVEDYNDSHIAKLKSSSDITVANTPQDLLKPGLTMSKVEAIIPLGSVKDAFDRRRTMSKIIIVDRCSQEMIENSPAFILAEALWKWDYTSYKIKSRPYLLKGGYDEWVLTYPMYTSNPNHVSKSSNFIPKRGLKLDFDYDISQLEPKEEKKSDNQMVNGVTNGDIEDESTTSSEQSVNQIFQSRPSNTAVPGTARPANTVVKTIPSVPDRSTKPKVQTDSKQIEKSVEELKEDIEKFKLKKQNEISEQMLSHLNEEYTKTLQKMEDDLKAKVEENNALKTQIRQILPKKPTIGPSNEKSVITTNGEMKGSDKRNGIYINESGDIKENGDNSELYIRNSVSMNGDMGNESSSPRLTTEPKSSPRPANNLSMPSNLSRSLSSPNIAQLLAKQDRSNNRTLSENADVSESKERSLINHSQPVFDRNLKPSFDRVSFQDTKLRDLCPVHSAGNSITGLKNLGNTCFMNAVIQCLLNTTDFSSFFIKGLHHINKHSKFGSNGELAMELAALFRAMAYPSSYKSISPKDFKQAVSKHIQGFIGCSQQDSHEFLVVLIERLHADLNESIVKSIIDTSVSEDLSLNARANKFWKEHINKNKSIITQLFEGLLVNTLTCLTCGKSSTSFEVFRCLSLPLGNTRTTLNECIKQFFKMERLSGEAAWECPTCKTKREAEKKIDIWKLPKVLIVHLKRFLYEGVWRQKIQTYVEFPIESLMMPSLSNNDSRYQLYGVVNHYGTLEGGHYTAFSQNLNKYKWHRFDDQEVTQMSAADVKTQAAYILFYVNT